MPSCRRMPRFAVLVCCVLAGACRTGEPLPTTPNLLISDANHNSGNAHFFFLPPVVSQPHPTGVFDGSLEPVVEICEYTTQCGVIVGRFTRRTRDQAGRGHGDGDDDADDDDGYWVVKKAGQHYSFNWNTKGCATGPCSLNPAKTYRIRILVAGVELGFADVDLVPKKDSLRNVNTNDYIGLVNGKSMTIKFRIEAGAIHVVPPAGGGTPVTPSEGGTVATADGRVSLVIPAGALAPSGTPTTITVAPVASPPADSALVPGTAVDFGPNGTQFSQPVTVKLAYDPAVLPAGAAEVRLRLFTYAGGGWQLVSGSRVDPLTHTVSGSVSHFSEYAILSLPPGVQTIVRNAYSTSGTFQLVWGGYVTSPIAWNASAATIQASLRAIPPLAQALVTGGFPSRLFTVDVSPYAEVLWVRWDGTYQDCYNFAIMNGDTQSTPGNVAAACNAATGPSNTVLIQDVGAGGAATQVFSFDRAPTFGSFQFVFGGYLSAPVPWNATAAEIQAILGAIPTLAQVVVTGSIASQTITIAYVNYFGPYARLTAGPNYQECYDTSTQSEDGTNADATTSDTACTDQASNFSLVAPGGVASYSQFQTFGLSAVPQSGSFQITWAGYNTAPIPWDATAAQIQTALQAIAMVYGFNNVAVTGSFASQVLAFGGTAFPVSIATSASGASYTTCYNNSLASYQPPTYPHGDATNSAAACSSAGTNYSLAGPGGPIVFTPWYPVVVTMH